MPKGSPPRAGYFWAEPPQKGPKSSAFQTWPQGALVKNPIQEESLPAMKSIGAPFLYGEDC